MSINLSVLKTNILCIALFSFSLIKAQEIVWNVDSLNTAKFSKYMQQDEKEMIYEINRLRSNPPKYAKIYIEPLLQNALLVLKKDGKGNSNYSIKTSFTDNKISKRDTIWHFANEEEVKALQTLYDTLIKLKALSILKPDEGIYKACIKHAKDQAPTGAVNHQGVDGSWPWERIIKFSPKMSEGNENIAYNSDGSFKTIVLQLLIDAGISDYGHRYNMLDASWTHIACYATRPPIMKAKWWIQNYGKIKIK